MWSSWSLIDWIPLARAQNLRKVCNTSLRRKHNFVICFSSLSILIAHIEPERQNQHPYMCGEGVLCSSSKPPLPSGRVSNNVAEEMKQTSFPSLRSWGLRIRASENSLDWKATMLDTTSNICLTLVLKDKVIYKI